MAAQELSKLIVVGDRVLIKPLKPNDKSKGGLYLPPGYQNKEEIMSGYVTYRIEKFDIAAGTGR